MQLLQEWRKMPVYARTAGRMRWRAAARRGVVASLPPMGGSRSVPAGSIARAGTAATPYLAAVSASAATRMPRTRLGRGRRRLVRVDPPHEGQLLPRYDFATHTVANPLPRDEQPRVPVLRARRRSPAAARPARRGTRAPARRRPGPRRRGRASTSRARTPRPPGPRRSRSARTCIGKSASDDVAICQKPAGCGRMRLRCAVAGDHRDDGGGRRRQRGQRRARRPRCCRAGCG